MGSFGKIGFISSLPISAGDETTLVFLKPNKYSDNKSGGITYSTDWYEPIFPPIFGEYDDYGKIESVKQTDSVKFIEEFFGLPINKIIDEVDDNSVGRHNSGKMEAPKNNHIYRSLTFGLEHTAVYEQMSIIRDTSFETDYNYEFWLLKFGFERIADNVDDRYKQTWIHNDLPGYTFNSDGTWGGLYDKNLAKVSDTYHPDDLEKAIMKINPNYTSKLTNDDRNMCRIDLSIKCTKLALEAREKEQANGDENDFRYRHLFDFKKYQGIPNITDFITQISIDGNSYSHGSRNIPELLLSTVNEKEIADMIRFNTCIARLNGKYQPSNYGSQDESLKLHNEMVKCYRNVVRKKMEDYDEDYFDEELSEFLSDDREDVIDNILN
jgi:hypothetical protein